MDSAMPQTLADDQGDLLRLLGYIYLQNDRPSQAVILFHAIHVLDPNDSGIAKSLACAYLRSGKPEDAVPLLDTLLARGDASPLTHLLRGQALARMGRPDESSISMRCFIRARAGLGTLEGR
ncbi:MAG: hypothetical protein JWQ23_1482 [Herminiimonas sp.]|nr:hypothetical protein [Herminiimonas sp.]